jgi:hypothetical protein
MTSSVADCEEKVKALKDIERILILFLGLAHSDSAVSMSMHIAAYLSGITDKSLAATLATWISSILQGKDFDDVKTADVDPNNLVSEGGIDVESVLSGLRTMGGNLQLLVNNPVFEKISYLLSSLACLGFCEASDLKWSVRGITLFAPKMFLRHVHAPDLLSAVMDTLVYFIEGGCELFRSGSIAGFLYSDSQVRALQNDYNELKSAAIHFRAGNLESCAGISVQDYDLKLNKVMDAAKKLSSVVAKYDKPVLDRMITSLYELRAEFTATRVKGGVRLTPYCIKFHGEGGCGKSTLATSIGYFVGKWNNFDGGKDRTITRRGDDKYDSNMRSDVNVVILEDIFNTAVEFMQSSPCDPIIVFVNSAVAYANMAEAELKGKVAINPMLVIITTNIKDTGATVCSNCPTSVTRRDNVCVAVSVKPEFRRDNSHEVDSLKVEAHYAAKGMDTPAIPDIFLLSAERPISKDNPKKGANVQKLSDWEPYHDSEGPLVDVGIHRFLAWLRENTRQWYELQRRMVDRINCGLFEMPLCDVCGMLPEGCKCKRDCGSNTPFDPTGDESSVVSDGDPPDNVVPPEEESDDIPGWKWPKSKAPERYPEPKGPIRYDETLATLQADRWWFLKRGMWRAAWSVPTKPLPHVYVEKINDHIYMPDLTPLREFNIGPISPDPPSVVEEGGSEDYSSLSDFVNEEDKFQNPDNLWDDIKSVFWYLKDDYKSMTTEALLELTRDNSKTFLKYTPDWLLRAVCTRYLASITTNWFHPHVCVYFGLSLLLAFGSMRNFVPQPYMCALLSFALAMRGFLYVYYLKCVRRALDEEIASRRDTIMCIVKTAKAFNLKNIKRVSTILIGFYTGYKIYKLYLKATSFETQGAMMPKCAEDIKSRDREKNPYMKASPKVDPASDRRLYTTNVDDAVTNVFNNLNLVRFNRIDGEGTTNFCDAFFIESSIAIVPAHMLKKDNKVFPLTASFERRGPEVAGGKFACKIDSENIVFVPGTDLALLNIPSSGTYRDLRHYLPDGPVEGFSKFVYKDKEGKMRLDSTHTTSGRVGHVLCKFDGYSYNLENDTHAGLCMGTLIRASTTPQIAGFHLGGNKVKDKYGVAGLLTRAQYELARKHIKDLIPHSASDIPMTMQGATLIKDFEIHHKCPAHYMDQEASCFEVIGGTVGASTFKSEVKVSLLSKAVEEKMGIPNKWGPPPSSPAWKAYFDTANKIAHGSVGFLPTDVHQAVEDYYGPIYEEIVNNAHARDLIQPLSEVETVNGIPGVRFVDAMNKKGAIGPPLTGPKDNYLEDIPGGVPGYENAKMFNDDIMAHVYQCRAVWAQGRRVNTPLKAFIKDEPTLNTKEKCRMIYAANIALQFEGRRLGLGPARFIQHYPILTESMVGVNAMSPEWDETVRHIKAVSDEQDPTKPSCSAGDYSSYDTVMPAQILWAAGGILVRMMRDSGNYTEEDMEIFKGFLTEVIYPNVCFNGTMFTFSSGHTSGGTCLVVILNNIANSLLKRIGFINVELKPRGLVGKLTFREVERCMNYGDDCKSAVATDKVLYWNMVSYRDFLGQHGIVFTMPNKEDEMVEFMMWDEAEFLKRKDSYIPEIKHTIGALALDSVWKSFHCQLKSKNITKEEHAIAVVQSGVVEIWAHGRSVYDYYVPLIREVVKECNLVVPGLDKTFDDRVAEWFDNYTKNKDVPLDTRQDSDEAWDVIEPEGGVLFNTTKKLLYVVVCGIGLSTHEVNQPGMCNYCKGASLAPQSETSGDVQSSVTESFYISSSSTDSEIVPHSGEEVMGVPTSRQPATQFSDYNAGYTYTLGDMSDATYNVCDEADLDLGKFFERPIKIATYNWAPSGGNFVYTLDPWSLFIEQPRVVNRINNYRNFRGRLHVRVLINGNPFYFGLAMVNYLPGPGGGYFDPPLDNTATAYCLASQNPHIYLDPTNSVGGEMVLPFFYPYNSADMILGRYDQLGRLYIRDVVDLLHANGSLDPLTITVFAWMSDVHLSGATAHDSAGLVPQGGDEYGDKPFSTMANSVAKAAGAIQAPSIRPYMRATEAIMSTVAVAAKAFGFSRPNQLSEVTPMKPTLFGNLVNANLGDACQKLTLDCKQEVTVDPRVVGMMPWDEMDLVELAKRESYITQFVWSKTDVSGDALHYHLITPSQFVVGVTGLDNSFAMTPSCWVAQPFFFWRGSMMLRFKIIASNFHKGRLRISYDANYSLETDEFNVVQNYIVDIAENKDFCMKIGWNSPKSYLDVGRLDINGQPYGSNPASLITNTDLFNGGIKVEVLNELTCPQGTAGSSVTIVVFTSMCDDFEVQSPDNAGLTPYSFFPDSAGARFVPEGGIEALDEHADMDGAPCMDTMECEIAPSLHPTDNTPGIYFGEAITSWRQCLKRYNFHKGLLGSGVAAAMKLFTRPNFPSYRGYSPHAVDEALGGNPYNFCDMTLLNWVTPAYGAMRGSLRWKWCLTRNTGASVFQATRSPQKPGFSETIELFSTAGALDNGWEVAYFMRKNLTHTWAGAVSTAPLNNPVLEFELPYQDNKRFWNARRIDYDVPNTEMTGYRVELSGPAGMFVSTYVAAGDDFGLFFFLNTPLTYNTADDPDPAPS